MVSHQAPVESNDEGTFKICHTKIKLTKFAHDRGVESGYLCIKLKSRMINVSSNITGGMRGFAKATLRNTREDKIKKMVKGREK